MTNIAIIVAGGDGLRMGGKTPKQYSILGGITLLERAVSTFSKNDNIDKIQVVIGKDHKKLYEKHIKSSKKLLPAIIGGKTRQESVKKGLEAIKEHKPAYVFIHDAARVFVSDALINNLFMAVKKHKAVIPAVKVADTLKKQGSKLTTVSRENLYKAQTPQVFAYDLISKAHQKFAGQNFTDDAEVIENFGGKVAIIEGFESNFKITTKDDMERAKNMIANKIFRTGLGFDVHAFEKGSAVIIGGVKIPHTHKLAGHSDADVAIHAAVDAIFGAIGIGDIGEHFPPSDKKWKNADSKLFLKYAAEKLAELGYELENLDVTIICEAPKITPHKKKMREAFAKILNVKLDRINIKATTTEGLGFTGRREGIAAKAVATASKMA